MRKEAITMMDSKQSEEAFSFFEAIETGLVVKLREMVVKLGENVMTNLAQSYTEQGATALLLAIQKSHLVIVKFLVEELNVPQDQTGRFVWKGREYLEIPPLFAAIISDQLCTIKYLSSLKIPDDCFDSFISSSQKSRSEKIDALELMGAAFIFQGLIGSVLFGWRCWKEAMTLREKPPNGEPKIPKTPYQLPELALQAMDEPVNEINSLEEMHEMVEAMMWAKQLTTQALLVSQRILNQMNMGSNLFTIYYIFKCIMPKCSWNGNERTCTFLLYIMKLFESYEWNQNKMEDSAEACAIIDELLVQFSIGHATHRRPGRFHQFVQYVNVQFHVHESFRSFTNLMKAFRFACAHIDNLYQYYWLQDRSRKIKKAAKLVFEFTQIIMKMLPELSQPENQEFKNCLSHYLVHDEGWQSSQLPARLIHWACGTGRKTPIYPKIEVIQLLLEAGIDPNAVDKDGNTPLLMVAQWPYCFAFGTNGVRMLLEAGAHLDQANNEGLTALTVLMRRQKNEPELYSLINHVLPLSCHCANVIRQHQIPFENKRLPASLETFVRCHSMLKTVQRKW